MLVSVLIPTRNRFEKLKRCVQSVVDSAGHSDEYEIIVRFHESDKESWDHRFELSRITPIFRCIQGPDLSGYTSLGLFYGQLIDASRGYWSWHLNDDMTVEGENWFSKLAVIPRYGVMVYPEFHKLNTSVYRHDAGGPSFLHPRTVIGSDILTLYGANIDKAVYDELVGRRSYNVTFLQGITVWHDWDGPDSHQG